MNRVLEKVLAGNLFQKLFKNPFKIADEILSKIVRTIYMQNCKVDNNKIFFSTFNGEYTCNPKAITEEILRRNLPWEIVWLVKRQSQMENVPESIKCVLPYTSEYFTEVASSKVWVSNSVSLTFYKVFKKASQVFFQTWHGSIGLKRFDVKSNKKWCKLARKDAKITNYCLSNSEFEDNLFKDTFWANSEILKYGHARNDILLKDPNDPKIVEIKEKLYSLFNISKGTKIALYAPTFRDDKELSHYDIDYLNLRKVLSEKFCGEWVILTRLHSRLKKLSNELEKSFPDFVINCSNYNDIQDIMLIADVGITDYSSWICDYLLTKKPGFIFATDIGDYNTERGFYYPLNTLPYPIAENNEQLIHNILNFETEGFEDKCQAFLDSKGCMDDGHAAERIVDKLEEIMNGN